MGISPISATLLFTSDSRQPECFRAESIRETEAKKTFKIPQPTFSRQPKTDKTKMSRVRQNFHEESEALINKQINMEMHASYVYLAMSSFFNREDQALPGFSKSFRKASDEERDHSMKLIEYQNMRGGKVVFKDVEKPSKTEWKNALEAVEDALELERTVNQSLLELHRKADSHGDAQMTDFVEGGYLKEQVEAIKELGDLVTKMKRVGDGYGLYQLDKDMAE